MLDGKVALITGATAGIGEATARLFAARGARLLLTGRNASAGLVLAAELGGAFLAVDIGAEEAPDRLTGWAMERHGRLDILVNNAGILL
ncbi:MAG: SDR family NAD(P)-dependent oxidoreductase, partial [Rhodospirillales bacterium]|nr:SDR family NAD(P)-dependent oxidoreductase [Rhodospirillales bacterium]